LGGDDGWELESFDFLFLVRTRTKKAEAGRKLRQQQQQQRRRQNNDNNIHNEGNNNNNSNSNINKSRPTTARKLSHDGGGGAELYADRLRRRTRAVAADSDVIANLSVQEGIEDDESAVSRLPSLGDLVILSEFLYLSGGAQLASVRFLGQTDFAPGLWVGVELCRPVGKNDGSVGGLRYFDALQDFGLFVKPKMCIKFDVNFVLDVLIGFLDGGNIQLENIFLEYSLLYTKTGDRLSDLEFAELMEAAGLVLPKEAAGLIVGMLMSPRRHPDDEVTLAELDAALQDRRHGRYFETPSLPRTGQDAVPSSPHVAWVDNRRALAS